MQQWKFKSFQADCNLLNPSEFHNWSPQSPNCVVNSSTEHFSSDQWYENINKGTLCVLQGTDWPDVEHCRPVSSIQGLENRFRMSNILFRGQKNLVYGNGVELRRFMLIGQK